MFLAQSAKIAIINRYNSYCIETDNKFETSTPDLATYSYGTHMVMSAIQCELETRKPATL